MPLLSRGGRVALIVAGVAAATLGVRHLWDGNAPAVLSCPSTIDLGERDIGEVVLGQFRVVNEGGGDLVLSQFKTSCTCAGVEVEDGGRTRRVQALRIAAGGSAELLVRIGVGGQAGSSQSVHVEFESNDPNRSTCVVRVHMPKIRPGVFTEPQSINFDAIPPGRQSAQVVRLYDNGVSGRRVEAARSLNPDRFEVNFVAAGEHDDPVVHESFGRYIGRVEVTAKATRVGPLDGSIELKLAGGPRLPTLIPVTGSVAAALECRPSTLVLPRTVEGRPVFSGQVELASRDGRPFQARVDVCPEGLSAVLLPVPGRADQRVLQVESTGRRAGAGDEVRVSKVLLQIEFGSGQSVPMEVTVVHPRGAP